MAIRVLVNGAFGKMGQEAVKALESDASFQLVGKTGRTDDLAAAIREARAEVVVDFTEPAAAYSNTKTIISARARPVIGTTGFTPGQIQTLSEQCASQQLGGIIAPNFSLGAVLMMKFAQQAAPYLTAVEIIELHQEGKKDAPSGTAVKTAELIAQGRSSTPAVAQTPLPPARGLLQHGIPIHSVRLPGIVANQEVLFGGQGETLKIIHNTLHREAFMQGVLFACRKVMELSNLVYGLEQLL